MDTKQEASEIKTISLWNPNTAVNWSVIFTPIFGAWLHAKNWSALGHEDKAKKSMRWVYAGIFIVIFFGLIIRQETVGIVAVLYLFSWYFISGRPQVNHVKKELNDVYNKKSWLIPISAAAACLAAYLIISISVNSQDNNTSSKESSSLPSEVTNNDAKNVFPACDSPEAKEAVKNAIENSPRSKTEIIKFFDVEGPKQYAYVPNESRVCIGIALTNGGRTPIKYSFTKNDKNEGYIEVKKLDINLP